jgi:hypothetical protein
MFKAFVCIIMAYTYSSGHGDGVAISTIGDIARVQDCQRIGKAAVDRMNKLSTVYTQPAARISYQCVEIYHTPE